MTDPTDWVMVPRVATEAMVERFHGLNRVRDSSARAKLDYQSMIAAAPQPPKMDREAVARIIDPAAWQETDRPRTTIKGRIVSMPTPERDRILGPSLAKADDIIALMEANDG